MSEKEQLIAESLNRLSNRLDQLNSGAVTPLTVVTLSGTASYGIRLEVRYTISKMC